MLPGAANVSVADFAVSVFSWSLMVQDSTATGRASCEFAI